MIGADSGAGSREFKSLRDVLRNIDEHEHTPQHSNEPPVPVPLKDVPAVRTARRDLVNQARYGRRGQRGRVAFFAGMAVPIIGCLIVFAPFGKQALNVFTVDGAAPEAWAVRWAHKAGAYAETMLAIRPSQGGAARTDLENSAPGSKSSDRAAPARTEAALSTPLKQPRLTVPQSVDVPLGSSAAMKIEIENAAALQRDSLLMVSNLPDFAALSHGYPLGAGTWVVPPSRSTDLSIFAYARPATSRQISIELVTGSGSLIASAQSTLDVFTIDRHVEAPPVVRPVVGKRGKSGSRT